MALRLLGSRLAVLPPQATQTSGGIHLPAEHHPLKGEVAIVSDQAARLGFRPGQTVHFGRRSGQRIHDQSTELILLMTDEVVAFE